LRFLGVFAGLGLVAALWFATWSARRSVPLISLALLGLNGTVIFWGDSLRAFGLGSALIVWTLAATCRVLEKPNWGRTAMLCVAAVLSVQALYQNAVFFAGIGLGGWLVCWLRRDKAAALKILVAALASIISLLPYLACILKWQRTTTIRPGFSFTAALDNLQTILAFPLPQFVWLWSLLALAVVGLGGRVWLRRQPLSASPEAGLRACVKMAQNQSSSFSSSSSSSIFPCFRGRGRERRRGRTANSRFSHRLLTTAELQMFAGVIWLISLGGYLVFLRLAALITSPWYFLPLMAVGAACFDLGIPLSTLLRGLRTASWGILVGTVVLSVVFSLRDLNCRFTNVDLVASYLKQNVTEQDYVVVTPWYLGISFDRYYRGAADWDTLPPVADHSTHRFDLVPTSAADTARAMQPALDRMASTLQAGHRVWVVGWMRIPDRGRAASTPEGRLLAEHSQSFEPVDLKIKGQTSDYEDVSLLLAIGWRTNQPGK
jgi:hypothetical protein